MSDQLATTADLEPWLPDLDPASPLLQAALTAASAVVRAAAGSTFPDGPSEAARHVTVQLAARLARNPEGYVSESEGGYTYQLPPGSTGLALTAAEREVLTGAPRARPRVWTLQLTRGGDTPDADEIDARLWRPI